MPFTRPETNRCNWQNQPDLIQNQSATVKQMLDELDQNNAVELDRLIDELEGPTAAGMIGAQKDGQPSNLQSMVDEVSTGKVDKVEGMGLYPTANPVYTAAEQLKLAGVEAGANAYTLPVATASLLGGVKQGIGVEIEPDGTLNGYGAPAPDEVARARIGTLADLPTVEKSNLVDAMTELGRKAGRGAYDVLIAAANASDAVKLAADYVCDGQNDTAVIGEAVAAAWYGKVVQLSSGTFHLTIPSAAAPAVTLPEGITLAGTGQTTLSVTKSGFGGGTVISVKGGSVLCGVKCTAGGSAADFICALASTGSVVRDCVFTSGDLDVSPLGAMRVENCTLHTPLPNGDAALDVYARIFWTGCVKDGKAWNPSIEVSLSLSGGLTSTMNVVRQGGVCSATMIAIGPASFGYSNDIWIGQLPSGFRPKKDAPGVLIGTAGGVCTFHVSPDGKIGIYPTSPIGGSQTWYFTPISWECA